MSTVERAAATANYFGGWGTAEDYSHTVSNVSQSHGKTDRLVEEMSRGIEQSGVSPKSQEDIQNLVISVAQEVAARHKKDGASDDEIAAARLIVLAKSLSHQDGNAQMSTIHGRQNLAQCLAGLVSSQKSNTVDAIKVAELVINSDYTKSLGRVEATLGQSLQTVDGSNQISDADKKAFAQAVYDSNAARSAGSETVTFLKNYLKDLARLQDHPDDLDAVSDAIFGSYLVNFGDAAQGLSGVELENGIGLAMGLKPDQASGSGKASLFSGEQLKAIKTIASQIQNLGGKNAKISAMPVLLAPSDSKAGIQKFMLWRVTTAQNKDIYVDTLGQAHNSVNDFIENNKLGTGRFVVARDGRMTINQNGKIDVQEVEKSAYSEQDAIKDAGKIRDALDKNDFIDWGTDEDAVYDVLKPRSAAEIDMIRKAYNKEYEDGHADFDKDLHDDFKDDKVELDRLNALLKGRRDTKSENEARAAEIKAELDDFAVDEQGVLKMFERIPAQERQTVAETYARMYGQSQKGAEAIDYLLSQCHGSFNDEEMTRAKDLLKPDGGDFAAGAARNSAARLHIAVAGAGTDEDTVFEVLSGKDPAQINAIKKAYQEKYGGSMEDRLKDDLNDGEWAYAEKLMNPLAPDADEASQAKWKAELSAAHLYCAMDGVGTNKDIIKAELKGKSPQEIQAIVDAYDYEGKGLSQRLKDDLEGKAEEDEILHLLDVAKVKDQASMDAWQIDDAAINLRLATSGLGDKDLIRQVLTGKSKVQIHGDANHEGVEQAYKRLYNRDLRADLKDQLDGRDWIEMRQIYDGGWIDLDSTNPDPEMITEFIRRQRELSEYERQGLSGKDAVMLANPVTNVYGAFKALGSDEVRGRLQKLTHWDSNYETDRERLDRNLGDAEKTLKEYKETGDRKKLAEATRLAGFAESDVKTVAQNKDALTNAVVTGATVVVGTIATLPVGGWGGIALAAGASALTAGVGYTAMDSQIGAGEITRQTLIASVAGGFGAPVRGASGAVTKVVSTETAVVGKTVALRSAEEGAVKLTSGSVPRAVERGLLRTEAEAGAARAGQPALLRTQLMTGAKMGAINNGAVAITDVATNPRLLHDPKAAILSVVTGVVSGAAMGVTFVGSALGLGRLFKATRQVRTTAESRHPFGNEVVLERLTPNRKAIEAGPQRKMLMPAADTPSVPPSTGPATRTIKGEVPNASSLKPSSQTMRLRLPDETGQTMEVTAQVMGRLGKKRLEEPLPDPADILLPGARDTGQRWGLLKEGEAYFVIRRKMGASSDHPVPAEPNAEIAIPGNRDDGLAMSDGSVGNVARGESSGANLERFDANLPWYLQPTNQFREWTARKIFSDQDHPLRFLLADRKRNPEVDPKIKKFRQPPSRRHEDLIGRSEDDILRPRTEQDVDHMPVYVQAGHLTSLSQLKAEAAAGLTPGEERFALQDAWLNQYDNIAGENAGVFMTRTAVDIGGIPVETRTAQMWEREGLLPQNTVANAPPHDGWTQPGSARNDAEIQRLVRDSADGVWKKAENIVGTPSLPPSTGPATRTIKGEVINTLSLKPANPTMRLHVPDETGQSVEIKAQVLGRRNRSGSHGLEERPLPTPSDILLPGAKDTGQKWRLEKDEDGYFVVPWVRGASSDHPVPVGSPFGTPSRGQAKIREQRETLVKGLASPPPIKYGGKDWAFVRVDGNGAEASVYLRPAESQDQLVARAELTNGTVFWENMKTGARRELNLNEKADKALLDRLTKPGESIRSRLTKPGELIPSPERLLFLHADDYVRQRARLNGTDPEPRIWRIGVSSDADLIRLKLPDSRGIRIPLHELKSVPVRLKGKERDGVFFLSLNDHGKLVVSRAGEDGKVEVRPDDVVGEYVNHPSYTLGKVPVKSTRAARWGELTGAHPPQEASHASPLDALSEYGIKPLPSGHIKTVEMGTGDQLIQKLTKFVEELEPQTPLVIRQWRFDDGGSEKNAPFMKELVRAICRHARSNAPVDLVLSRGKLSPTMELTLADAGVRVHVASNLPHKMVVHQKSIATPDKSIIYTGPFDPKAGKRMEMMVELPPHLSRLYFQHEALAATRGSAVGLQQKYLADLAAHGVVIDRPDVSTAYAGRSYWALARGAKKSIELYVKELAHPEFTKILLEKARHGISIKIRLAEPDNDPLDNASQRLILQALRENPDLDISVKSYEWNEFPYRHFNAVIADNEVGAFGTLYPWSNGLGQIDPAGSGTEHALILAGKDLASMRDVMKRAEETIKESGHGTYSTVDEVPAVSIFGFRGAGSSKDL